MPHSDADSDRFKPEHAAYMPGHADSPAQPAADPMPHAVPDAANGSEPDSITPTAAGFDPAPKPAAKTAADTADKESQPAGRSHWQGKSFIDKAASLISWILVPLMMPVYATWMLLELSPLAAVPAKAKIGFLAIIFGINMLVPMLLVYLLKLFGLVHDVGLNNRRERLIPYIITVVALAVSAWFVGSKGAPLWIMMFYAGGACAGLINFIINFRWKISAHAAGIAGVVALLVRLSVNWIPTTGLFVWTIIWVLLSGLLGSARVWLGRHTVWQVVAGYAVGFISVYLLTML